MCVRTKQKPLVQDNIQFSGNTIHFNGNLGVGDGGRRGGGRGETRRELDTQLTVNPRSYENTHIVSGSR